MEFEKEIKNTWLGPGILVRASEPIGLFSLEYLSNPTKQGTRTFEVKEGELLMLSGYPQLFHKKNEYQLVLVPIIQDTVLCYASWPCSRQLCFTSMSEEELKGRVEEHFSYLEPLKG